MIFLPVPVTTPVGTAMKRAVDLDQERRPLRLI